MFWILLILVHFIEVTDRTSEAVLINLAVTKNDTGLITLEPDTMQPFATIKGKIDYDAVTERRFAQVVGLERLVEVDIDGFFAFNDLPEGIYTINIISADPEASPIVHKNVTAISGQTTLTAYQGWLHSMPIYLNTTSSGAAVYENVYNFPVLVRLNRGNFNFSEAKGNGEDVRFVKPDVDSTPLLFEIERWDSSTGAAEIWVRVDTVYANTTRLSFVMMWGNQQAENAVQSGSVFDTADGFGAVWHLSGEGNAKGKDATQNGFDGRVSNVGSVEGMIGSAGLFTGTTDDSYITIENSASGKLNFPEDGHYSVSAWVNSDSINSNRTILSKSDVQYYLKIHGFKWHFAEYQSDPAGWDFTETDSSYSYRKWVYLCGVRNNDKQYLFVDGVCVDSTISHNHDTLARDESFNVEIGRRIKSDGDDGQYFEGKIDEVRICTKARNTSWIKLSYESEGR